MRSLIGAHFFCFFTKEWGDATVKHEKSILIYQQDFTCAAECTPQEREKRLLNAIGVIETLQGHDYFSDLDRVRWKNVRSFLMIAMLIAEKKSGAIDVFLDEKRDTVSVVISAADMEFDRDGVELLAGLCESARNISFVPPSSCDARVSLRAQHFCFQKIAV